MSNFRMSRHGAGERGRRSGTKNVGSGEISHQEKKKGVARDVEIEIDQTVHEEAGATDKARKMESGGEGLVLQEHTTERTKKQSAENQAQHAAPAIPVSARASR